MYTVGPPFGFSPNGNNQTAKDQTTQSGLFSAGIRVIFRQHQKAVSPSANIQFIF